MERMGREFLREALRTSGDADTIEDMLRIGFHCSNFLSVYHLHMHILYPISGVSLYFILGVIFLFYNSQENFKPSHTS